MTERPVFPVARWVGLAWLAVWIPAYWSFYGPVVFLNLCDIAVVLTCVGLWRGSALLLSSQAVSSLVVDLAWVLDLAWRGITGRHLIGGTEYMWDPAYPGWLRALSLFHIALPIVLIWSLRRVGYDLRAPYLQIGITAVVLVASRLVGAAENANFAFTDPLFGRSWGPAPVHLAVILGGLAVVYGLTHLVLRRLAPAPAGIQNPAMEKRALFLALLAAVLARTLVAAEPPLRSIGFLVLPGVYNSELMAPYDVFDHVRFRTPDAPKVFTVAKESGPVRTFEGLTLIPHYTFANAPAIDLLVVPSAEHNMDTDLQDAALIAWVRETGRKAKLVMSLCDGSFVLAKAGLLDGLEATTFPGDQDRFASAFPGVKLQRAVIFVHDGKAITSVGGARSYDPAMYLVERLYGADARAKIGEGLVLDWTLPTVKHRIAPGARLP